MVAGMDVHYHYHGEEQCASGQHWGPGIKDCFKIHLIQRGKGIFTYEGQCYQLERNEGFLIHPNSIAYYQADLGEPWRYSWIAFIGADAHSLLEQAQLTKANPIFTIPPNTWLEQATNAFMEANRFDKGRNLALQSVLYRFFAELTQLSNYEMPDHQKESQKEIYVQLAKDYIQAHYHRKLSIAEIAQQLAVNRIYFSELFKEQMGTSPQSYLLRFRMEKACQLMKNSAYSIASIGRSVGYNDPLLFSKMFKKVNGISPTAFRLQQENR